MYKYVLQFEFPNGSSPEVAPTDANGKPLTRAEYMAMVNAKKTANPVKAPVPKSMPNIPSTLAPTAIQNSATVLTTPIPAQAPLTIPSVTTPAEVTTRRVMTAEEMEEYMAVILHFRFKCILTIFSFHFPYSNFSSTYLWLITRLNGAY